MKIVCPNVQYWDTFMNIHYGKLGCVSQTSKGNFPKVPASSIQPVMRSFGHKIFGRTNLRTDRGYYRLASLAKRVKFLLLYVMLKPFSFISLRLDCPTYFSNFKQSPDQGKSWLKISAKLVKSFHNLGNKQTNNFRGRIT